jgi:glucose-6-phosphate isomerase
MKGAESYREKCLTNDFENNEALKYAAVRNILLKKRKKY